MAQQESLDKTIANDVVGFIPSPVRKLWDKYSGAADKVKAATKKVDTSYHDKAVEAANESFRKAAEEKTKVGKKPAPKRAGSKR